MVFFSAGMQVLTYCANLPILVALACIHLAPSLPVSRAPISRMLPVARSRAVPSKSRSVDGAVVLGEMDLFAR